MITTRWWWIRHAPVVNVGGRIYGRLDVEADCTDAPTFAALAARLPARPVWLVTPLRRTQQTLAGLHAALGLTDAPPPLVEPALMEQDFGSWQGLTHAEIDRERGAEAHRFWVSPAHHSAPGGESFADVVERVGPAVTRVSAAQAGRDIVAVAHGGSIRAALAVALALDPELALRFTVANLSLTRIDHLAPKDGTPALWRIGSVNVTSPTR